MLKHLVGIAHVCLFLVASVYAQTPKEDDFRSCNAEADAAVKAGTSTPTPKDREQAEAARKSDASARRTDDPQVRGMSPDRANDAEYRSAYRSCMRRSGF